MEREKREEGGGELWVKWKEVSADDKRFVGGEREVFAPFVYLTFASIEIAENGLLHSLASSLSLFLSLSLSL